MQAVPRSGIPLTSALDDRRWVLFAVQLPANPSKARVKVWRRLQQLGAVPVKHAVYVLPYSTQAVEDFAWLKKEVESAGGQAAVFSASAVEDVGNADIVEQFKAARTADYRALQKELRSHIARSKKLQGSDRGRAVRALRERFEQIRSVDFFATPAASEVEVMLETAERATRRSPEGPVPARTGAPLDTKTYSRRTWVTRPRPGVDRFASAWLIRRLIDPHAKFVFADHPSRKPRAVPFDMYDGAGFGHEGGRCTFEVLLAQFGPHDGALSRIAELVHDADLKDNRYHSPQAATIELIVQGLRASIADDARLLEHGIALFEALYQGFAAGPSGPRRKKASAR